MPQAIPRGAAPWAFLQQAAPPAGTPPLPRAWVYRQVLHAIRRGELDPGQRLPSARALAKTWHVARGAIDDALAQLQQEGFVERQVGRGSFVAYQLPVAADAPAPSGPLNAATQEALRAVAPLLQLPVRAFDAQAPRRLRPRASEIAQFPLAAWRRCVAQGLAEGDRSQLSYGVAAGTAQLREATARYLALTRSISCRPEQVIILNNPLQGIDLIARVLLEPGDRVCVEDPGYMSIPRCLSLAHLDVRGIAVDEHGFDPARAEREVPDAAAIYLHPLVHYPTGARTTAARRAALLAWADRCGAWVIEGDQFGEIVHDKAAPPALHCSDRAERVLFIGSFNGVMFPGLRLAYMVVPPGLVDVFAAVRGMLGDHSPAPPQLALAAFIDDGHLSAHLRRLRTLYRQRRDALAGAAARHLPAGYALGPMAAGVHAGLALPAGTSDVALCAQLAASGVGAEPMSAYTWRVPARPGLVMGYGGDEAATIDEAMAIVAAALPRTG